MRKAAGTFENVYALHLSHEGESVCGQSTRCPGIEVADTMYCSAVRLEQRQSGDHGNYGEAQRTLEEH